MIYTTFRALVNIPKEQQKSDTGRLITVQGKAITMVKPLYETESEVTEAIAAGTLKGSSSDAYYKAKEWQKQCKESETRVFRAKPATPRKEGSYTHTMQFSH